MRKCWRFKCGNRISTIEDDPLKLDREIDWVIKYRLIEAFCARHDIELDDPRARLFDLQYHDISQSRGLFHRLEQRNHVERMCDDEAIVAAQEVAPQSTRARLRGEFIRRARERGRDVTVDWVHLKVNDQAQRTVLCKDPFAAVDERVDRLIEQL